MIGDNMNYQVTNYPIDKAIDCMSGNSGLTEEFIYSTTQIKGHRYIVLSSATGEDTMMGEVPMCQLNNKPLKVFENKEGLLVARNGKAGTTTFLKAGHYTINDHAYILSVKDTCPYSINLKWLAIQYKTEFLNYSSSSDNGTWNKTGFFKNLKLDIPPIEEQNRIVEIVEQAYSNLEVVQNAINEIERIYERKISVDYIKYQAKNIYINKVIDCMSGNSGLTEEFIYNNYNKGGTKYKVLSGATQEENYLGIISNCELNGKNLKVFEDKCGLLIVRKGKAGYTKFLPKDNYTINDDAYILYVKNNCKYEINLRWFEVQYKSEIMAYSSSSDNGTWNKTGFFKNVKIDIPDIQEQDKMVRIVDKARDYLDRLTKIKKELLELIDKELYKKNN
jgi:restriction endonuclease S subunit